MTLDERRRKLEGLVADIQVRIAGIRRERGEAYEQWEAANATYHDHQQRLCDCEADLTRRLVTAKLQLESLH